MTKTCTFTLITAFIAFSSFPSLVFAESKTVSPSVEKIRECHNSSYSGKIETVKKCLNAGYDINQKDQEGRTLIQMAVLGEGFVKTRKKNKEVGHHMALINFLIKKADLTISDKRGKTLAHQIVLKIKKGKDASEKNKKRYSLLLQQLKDRKISLNIESEDKRTPLMDAVYYGNLPAVKVLLELGIDINYRNKYTYSVAKYIAISNNLQILKFLISKGLDLTSVNRGGYTMIALAVKHRKIEMFNYLVKIDKSLIYEPGTTKYLEAGYEGTLFDIALSQNQFQLADQILELGYPIDYQKKYGETALMEHVLYDRGFERVEYLLSRSASTAIKDDFSENALDKAKFAETKNTIILLKRH